MLSLDIRGTMRRSEQERKTPTHKEGCRDEIAAANTGKRLITSDFVFATLANFINGFGVQMLLATLPVYTITLGGTKADAGLVSGASFFAALLLRPFAGRLTDAWRRRPMVLIGTCCFSLGSLLLLAASIPFLLLGRLTHGVGSSFYTTSANAYIADIAPSRRRAESIGIFAAAQAFGFIIGPAVGFLVIKTFGFRQLFYFTSGLYVAAFLCSFFTRERRKPREVKLPPWSLRTGIVAVESLPVAWIALCIGMGFGTVNAFIAIFAQPRGLANPGFYFTVEAMALLISRAFSGRFADRHSRPATIVPGLILMAASLGFLPWAHGLSPFLLSALLFGIGFGTVQPAAMALLVDRVRPERRGLAMSTYFMGFDAGTSMGAILLGLVSARWGFAVTWPLAATCTLLGLSGLLAERRRSTS